MNRHHKLLEEIGHLKDRERVLLSENDQLHRQLVVMKEQEKKKYDDLMVQYNMKREYEDDGLDKQGTSNNQVTVKTEWDHEEVKVEIKEEDGRDNIIKREYVPAYIKTDSSDMKVEIKEEDDGCDRCVLMKEDLENGEMVEVKEEIKDENEEENIQINVTEEVAESSQGGEDECGSVEKASMDPTVTHPTGQSQNASNANESIEVCVANLSCDQHNTTTLNEPNEVTTVTQSAQTFSPQTSTGHGSSRTALDQQTTVTQSAQTFSPQTSTGHGSSRTALDQQTTVPTRHNKRKQQTSKRSVKRSKNTIEEDEGEDGDGEDIANEDREEAKVKVLHLNCTQSNCNVKLDSMVHLHDHLSTVHQLSPLQCFATNCNARFDDRTQISVHTQLHHSRNTRFICSVCQREYGSQHKTYQHWYHYHLTGQFKCNFVNDCGEVTDTRRKMTTHQKTKHYSQSNHFHCTHPGCTASFAFKNRLKQHQLTHLATNQFHCNWPHCNKQCKQRGNLVMHIRTQHFGLPPSMKAQMEKNIVDLRDPNEYVRVVVDE